MTLTEFLLARIAEDESVGWTMMGQGAAWKPQDPRGAPDSANGLDATHDGLLAHPTRIVREAIAKRHIVQHLEGNASKAAAFTLGAILAIYVDHPEYHDEWGPR